jgi:hypothetical protein
MVGSNYFVMIKGNVADSRGTNNIDPYTLIGVSWEVKTNIMQMSDSWSFYSGSAFLDPSYPDVYDDFMNPGYVINYNAGWGGPASGILYFVQVDPSLIVCAGDRANGAIGFQNSPACFVRTVVIPTNYLASAQNAILTTNRFIADDGMILYINGQEVYRWNIAGTLPLNESTLAAANQGIPPCQTVVLTLTNVLRPGTNYIAAAVVQSAAAEGDVVFGLEVDATFLRTSPTPPPASGILFSNRWDFNRTTTNLVLNWPTNFYGSKLEYTTNLGADAIWLQVKDQNDPYTNNVSGATAGPRRFYRLVINLKLSRCGGRKTAAFFWSAAARRFGNSTISADEGCVHVRGAVCTLSERVLQAASAFDIARVLRDVPWRGKLARLAIC